MNRVNEQTDEDIVRAVVAGEKELYRELVERHKNMVFGMLLRQSGDKNLAEELSQEAFVKAYLNLKSFRFEAKFSTWLVRIALHASNTFYSSRRFKESQLSETFDAATHVKESASGPEQDRIQEESINYFRQALARLDSKYREAITLCALEGKTYEEAAEIMQVPVGTVRSRLNTARLLLKQASATLRA